MPCDVSDVLSPSRSCDRSEGKSRGGATTLMQRLVLLMPATLPRVPLCGLLGTSGFALDTESTGEQGIISLESE